MNLLKILGIAKKASLKSDHHSFLIGAVVFTKKNIISVGYNHLFKTHPIFNKINNLKTLHAEASAILGARHLNLKGASIAVYREHKDGTLAQAKPCKDCEELLRLYGIEKVYYTNNGTVETMKL